MDEYEEVGILLVEDSPLDAELMLRGLKDQKLANPITWVKDGEEAVGASRSACSTSRLGTARFIFSITRTAGPGA